MSEWHPPRETGLIGGLYLEEDLLNHVDDLADVHGPGVYALKLSVPDSRDVVEARWATHYDVDVPEWVWAAYRHEGVLYVGAAKNVFERLTEHLGSPNRTASLCRVFPPHSVWDVWLFDDVTRAFDRESGIAIQLRNELPSIYVHQS